MAYQLFLEVYVFNILLNENLLYGYEFCFTGKGNNKNQQNNLRVPSSVLTNFPPIHKQVLHFMQEFSND